MPLSLANAIVYDTEVYPTCFTLQAEGFEQDWSAVWEISHYRDDRAALFEWFDHLARTGSPMIGFFSLKFDYIVIHMLFHNRQATVEQIYEKAQSVINSVDKFGHMVWDRDRFAPQIDLFSLHHFDNKAKTTSLKALEINMRSENVVDLPFPPGSYLTAQQVNDVLVPYGKHDTAQTKKFAHYSRKAMDFRIGMMETITGDVMNFNDTKIGEKLLEQRIGEDICYERNGGRRQPRQTIRSRIALRDIIFPYIKFNNPEFQRVHQWMLGQTLTSDDLDDPEAEIKTKGVFKGVTANVGGVDFYFGTGGIHASVPAQRIIATDEWLIRDIDVASLYPSIAIVNRLAPEHLGEPYTREYGKLPIERQEWQKKKGKKCVEANSLKLSANGVYGKSNSKFSVFYDPQYTMTITINGQLMLCMLAEQLLTVPTLRLIQANTDGITYYIHRDHEPAAAAICKAWEAYTLLKLEDVNYSRMWIRDVNNYVAESPDGSLKCKGAYWTPALGDGYADSISEQQPPAWHKDLGNCVSIRAAVAAMVHGVDPGHFVRLHTDPFDFMCRVKADRSSRLMLGDRQVQNTTRYYVAKRGQHLRKISPPTGPEGTYKRKTKLSDADYNKIAATIAPGTHDPRIHTANKSKYEQRETAIEAGYLIAECNDARHFDWNNVNFDWYIGEARKLVI